MENDVHGRYEGQVPVELTALTDSVQRAVKEATQGVNETPHDSDGSLKNLSRIRMADVVAAGILIAKLGVRPRLNASIREHVERDLQKLPDPEKNIELFRSISDPFIGHDIAHNYKEVVTETALRLVDTLGISVHIAPQVSEVCLALLAMSRRHTHGSHGLIEVIRQIMLGSMTMPEMFESAFRVYHSVDFGSSIERRAINRLIDQSFSDDTWKRPYGTRIVDPHSSPNELPKLFGYDSIEDLIHAILAEHYQQIEILDLNEDLTEILKIPPKNSKARTSYIKDLVDVYLSDVAPSKSEQITRDIIGLKDGSITTAGMLSMRAARWEDIRAHVTPKRMAELMLELASPAPGERVYDPCFGLGQLLVGAAKRQRAAGTLGAAHTSSGDRGVHIYGVERDLFAFATGLCRLMLADVAHPSLMYDDALDPMERLPHTGADQGFDCVVAAPPCGREAPMDAEHPLPSRSTESKFLQHVMGNLRSGGRAVIALPEGPLYRAEDRHLRKELLSDYRVDGVVSLPAGAFEPCTSLPMSLLMLSRRAPLKAVRFAHISPEMWEPMTRSESGEAFRAIAALFRHPERDGGDADTLRIEVWNVPLREIEDRDYELTARKSGNEALEAELARLVEADPSLVIEQLDHVADVQGGLSYKQRFRKERGDRLDVIAGLIYPGDVTDHGIRTPTWFLAPDGISLVKERALLRGGDLVVRTAGTVGNIGLVENDVITMVATTGVAQIRTHNGIDPRFLAALMSSPIYRDWLSGHARGPTHHLSLRRLRSLKIPVPPLSMQTAVVEEIHGPRADALAVLFRLMSGTVKSPLVTWLETPVAARLAAATENPTDGIDTLAEVVRGIQSLAVPKSSDRSIRAWLQSARKAAAALDDITSIPRSSGRLAILQFGMVQFLDALGRLDQREGSVSRRLRSLTRAMVKLVEREVHAMQHSATVDIGVDKPVLIVGMTDEVRLRVTNSSDVVLRSVAVTVRSSDGSVAAHQALGYFPEGETRHVPLEVRPTDSTQPLSLAVSWNARLLDGTPVQGAQEVSVLVSSRDVATDKVDLRYNPYIVGSWVDRAEMFFGRDGEMCQIRRQLGDGDQTNVILLEGNRRTGKTSILKQLEKVDALSGWIPVYCSLQGVNVAAADVFRLLARKTYEKLADAGIETWTWLSDQPKPDSRKDLLDTMMLVFSDGHPYETLEVYLAAATEAAEPKGILLMLDEFDKLQASSPQVPENIRHLLQHQPGLGAIITGSHPLKRLREEYWSPLFGFGYRIEVSALPPNEARRLVTEPVEGRLHYLDQACERILGLCAYHPFLIQSLCHEVFEQAATGEDQTITLDTVERAVTAVFKGNIDTYFSTLFWNFVDSERSRLLLYLCDYLADDSDAVNIYLLRTKLDQCRIPVRRDKDLADDIAVLRQLELVDFDTSYRDGTYRLSTPLMSKWLRKKVDFDDLVVRPKQEVEDKR